MKRADLSIWFFLTIAFGLTGAEPAAKSAIPEGILPLGADGKPLNLDFETGTLKDWKAEGDAFIGQPIKGDTVYPRRNDMRSQHQGHYWIGGYELRGDKPQGTLTSVPFKITHSWASFLVGGGPHPTTCVELVLKESNKVFYRASGFGEENLRRVVVDLKPHMGNEMFIRVVDNHSGHWGHINFDDFRFHADKPDFPVRHAVQPAPPPDEYKYAGLRPEKAAQVMTVPEGFTVKLFAGEPDVRQPIAMCLDDRGRVWVAEAYCYPVRRPDMEANDRILILEDTDGDGKFGKRTVFMEGLNLVSGLEIGFGGVWIGAAPYLMFVPVKAGEDKPAGPPQILLDGWAWQDTHETLNTFTWGPDGWLYGCHGVFTHSRVGKPGTPDAKRTPINAGIWRYHPTKHVFEVFAHGTSNPWGLDFNDYGQAFCEACVIPHAFHIIQGARYHRQAGNHFNPFTYADIPTIADHVHYVGATPHGGNNRSDSAGGGHAHCGTMIYLGGTWPEKYRNQWFMGNLHGRRLNMDHLQPKGSGYNATHGPDFLLANDAWARFINLRYGPDGNVFLIDWYDKQACHTGDVKVWDRSNGRIYKICYQGTKPVKVDLAKYSDKELVELQLHQNDWYVRHARRLLQERAQQKNLDSAVYEALDKIAFTHADETRRLRGLWALHVVGGLDDRRINRALADKGAYVQSWAIQLAMENQPARYSWAGILTSMAKDHPSPVVRLYLAATLQRRAINEEYWRDLDYLVSHAEDATDHNLPLMYWYAAEPLAAREPSRALELAAKARIPQLLPFMIRRIGSSATPKAIALLVSGLDRSENSGVQLTYLRELQASLKGRRQVAMPAGWREVFNKLNASGNAEVCTQATRLAVTFGDPLAFETMRRVLASRDSDLQLRQNALAALLEAKDEQLAPILQKLVSEPDLRSQAMRGLAVYDDSKTPEAILAVYSLLKSEEKRDGLSTLASRVSYANALLEAVAAKKIPAAEVSADIVRQLRNLQDKAIDQRIGEVWGIVRDTPVDRAKLMVQYRKMLTNPSGIKPDLSLGRAIFAKTCAQCHTLFGIGGKVGPDITGSNRVSLDYLLENILDPSAVIPKEYAVTLIELLNGRVITGIVRSDTSAAVTVVTANETITVPRDEIASMKPTNISMMPEDQLKPMKDDEVRALFAYLQSPSQVPMLATAENAKDFFNGKDLSGWDGDMTLWKVENGEIVGRSPRINRNEFLRGQFTAGDFRLKLKVKLVPNTGNSGVQFRSEVLPGGDVKGPQADIGAGWWGKLYEENGRGVIWDKSGEAFVKADDWNDYEIIAIGSRIRTWINGKPCVDLDDPAGSRRGVFALQIHSGAPMEVRFKDLRLEVKPETKP